MTSNELEEAIAYRFAAAAIERGFSIDLYRDGKKVVEAGQDPERVLRAMFAGHEDRLELSRDSRIQGIFLFRNGVNVEVILMGHPDVEAVLYVCIRCLGGLGG